MRSESESLSVKQMNILVYRSHLSVTWDRIYKNCILIEFRNQKKCISKYIFKQYQAEKTVDMRK